jgi:hypothetical protein
VLFVELEATLTERLRRNETEFRLAEKPYKRDLTWSRQHLLDSDARYQFNSGGQFAGRSDYLHIDNTTLSPKEIAEQVIVAFDLPYM